MNMIATLVPNENETHSIDQLYTFAPESLICHNVHLIILVIESQSIYVAIYRYNLESNL